MNSAVVKLRCGGCGKPFERPRRRHATLALTSYCSRACRRQWVSRTCEACRTAFTVKAGAARTGRWCSRACADIGRKRGERRTCPTCTRTFYASPSRNQTYCSNTCKGQAVSVALKGKPKSAGHRAALSASAIKRAPPKPKVTCDTCGTVFEIPSYRPRKDRIRFCSTVCLHEWRRDHPEAATAVLRDPSFTGRNPYYGPNWRHQARLARERDAHTCQDCGIRRRRPLLHVHHIIPRRSFGADYKRANALGNLITLCPSCHARWEWALMAKPAPRIPRPAVPQFRRLKA